MRVIFADGADGRVFPDYIGVGQGNLDCAITGTLGLITLLETQLGLTGPAYSSALRVAVYVGKLRAAGSGRFWEKSFERDAWATAELLLSWRDGLVEGGWKGQRFGSPGLDDLAAAEAAGDQIPRGAADRIAELTRAVGSRPGLRLREITVCGQLGNLRPPLRTLLGVLKGAGVLIRENEPGPAALPGSDLGRVQKALKGGPASPLQGDGSFLLVNANTETMAAEAIAEWLAAGGEDGLKGTVLLSPEGDTALLDNALSAHGLPALGLSAASPWRGAMQVLPLAFSIAWKPFDPKSLLNLLMLPRPPLRRWAAARLAKALTAQPGQGGPAWVEAWDEIEKQLIAEADKASDGASSIPHRLKEWKSWTDGGLFDREQGMPLAEARNIAARVASWALRLTAASDDPLLLSLSSAANSLSEVFDSLRMERLPARLIERVMAQVLADGEGNPAHIAQSGGLRAIQAPDALCGEASRLVWWNCVGPGDRVRATPWARSEMEALASAGIELERPADASARIASNYVAAILRSTAQVLLVRPLLRGAEPTVAHPIMHQLHHMIAAAGEKICWNAETLIAGDKSVAGGHTMLRQADSILEPPAPCLSWTLSSPPASALDERNESATSLDRLFGCQMNWLTHYLLRIRPGRFAEIPDARQLFGNLAHVIVQQLFAPGSPPDLATVRTSAEKLFDALIPQMAAPLLQPEHAAELASARSEIPAAVHALAQFLREKNLEVIATEASRNGAFGPLQLQGHIDLLLKAKSGKPAFLDLKWTNSERWYRGKIEKGSAVQLAVYSHIADPTAGPAEGGYFLLKQRRAFAERGSMLADDPVVAAKTLTDTLHAAANDWKVWIDTTRSGAILAAGMDGYPDVRPPGLLLEAAEEPCTYCDYVRLCRVNVETK